MTKEMAETYSCSEAIERWILAKCWLRENGYEFADPLQLSNSELYEAVLFEWQAYGGIISCFPIINPFGIPVVLTKVDVQINNSRWVFYGNGCGESVFSAAEKGLMESLQFLPRNNHEFYDEIANSKEVAKKRVREWSLQSKELIHHSNFYKKIPAEYLIASDVKKSINLAMREASFKVYIEEIAECPNLFMAYTTHEENWNEISGVPIA